jgi:uncharacterized protein (DUF1697 family)
MAWSPPKGTLPGMTRLLLFRGINVGGKNKISMATLREGLAELGCAEVQTYINSGNAIVDSPLPDAELAALVEEDLPTRFHLDSELVRVLVLSPEKLRAVIEDRPKGFGDKPDTYHSDAIFLIGIGVEEAMAVFQPREGVDAVWPGAGVIYSQRLSAERTKSRLGRIIGTPAYASMTIRSWQTTLKLRELVDARA